MRYINTAQYENVIWGVLVHLNELYQYTSIWYELYQYSRGEGGPQDLARGGDLIQQAASNKSPAAEKFLKDMMELLD